MDQNKRERLIKKYENYTSTRRSQATMAIGRGGGAMAKNAMGKTGKPKNTWSTLWKLLRYIAEERTLFIIAVVSAIIHTFAMLIASYMLRPIMNAFLYYDPNETDLTGRVQGLIGGLAMMALIYAVSIFTQWLQQRLMLRYRSVLYGKCVQTYTKNYRLYQCGILIRIPPEIL